MTKSEIVKEISARTGIDSKAVLAVVEGFMTEVKTSLGKEENVYLQFESIHPAFTDNHLLGQFLIQGQHCLPCPVQLVV